MTCMMARRPSLSPPDRQHEHLKQCNHSHNIYRVVVWVDFLESEKQGQIFKGFILKATRSRESKHKPSLAQGINHAFLITINIVVYDWRKQHNKLL